MFSVKKVIYYLLVPANQYLLHLWLTGLEMALPELASHCLSSHSRIDTLSSPHLAPPSRLGFPLVFHNLQLSVAPIIFYSLNKLYSLLLAVVVEQEELVVMGSSRLGNQKDLLLG